MLLTKKENYACRPDKTGSCFMCHVCVAELLLKLSQLPLQQEDIFDVQLLPTPLGVKVKVMYVAKVFQGGLPTRPCMPHFNNLHLYFFLVMT